MNRNKSIILVGSLAFVIAFILAFAFSTPIISILKTITSQSVQLSEPISIPIIQSPYTLTPQRVGDKLNITFGEGDYATIRGYFFYLGNNQTYTFAEAASYGVTYDTWIVYNTGTEIKWGGLVNVSNVAQSIINNGFYPVFELVEKSEGVKLRLDGGSVWFNDYVRLDYVDSMNETNIFMLFNSTIAYLTDNGSAFHSSVVYDPIVTITGITTAGNKTDVIGENGFFTHLNISTASPYNSLIGYWSFDGDQVNTPYFTAYDMTKNNRDGQAWGNATKGAEGNKTFVNASCGLYGNGACFSGASNILINLPYIRMLNASAGVFSNKGYNFTVMAWVKSTQQPVVSRQMNIVSWGNSTAINYDISIYIDNDTYAKGKINIGGQSFTAAGATPLGDGNWHHIAFAYNGTTASSSGYTELWVDGVNVSIDTSGPVSDNFAGDTLTIGAKRSTTNSSPFIGSIDEVMIFNDSLVSSQTNSNYLLKAPAILAIYYNQSPRFAVKGFHNFTQNISSGYNYVNVTTEFDTNMSSAISLFIQYYDGSWHTSPLVNLTNTNGMNSTIFEITSATTNLHLNYTMYPGNGTYNPFYSPIMKNNITIETFSIAGGDTMPPSINITYPDNGTVSSDYNLPVNFTYSDNYAVDVCWWSDDYGATNISNDACDNLTGAWVAEGNNVTIWVNDTSGNEASAFVYFFIDSVAPNGIGFITPTPANNTNLSQDNYLINVSFNDNHPDWCYLELDNGSGKVNYTMSPLNSTNFYYNVTSQPNLSANYTAYCNDNSFPSNWGKSGLMFVNISLTGEVIDTTPPNCQFIIPTPNNDTNLTTNNNYFVNLTCSETINTALLELTNTSGKFNYTMIQENSTTYWFNVTGQKNNQTYFYTYVTDTAGNLNRTPYVIFVNISFTSICQTLSTANSIYYIYNNVTSAGTCFTVTANNIILDCQSNAIIYTTSAAGYGVTSNGYNATIKNCFIWENRTTTTYPAIYFLNSYGNQFINNTIITQGEPSHAIYLLNSNLNNITNNTMKTIGDDTACVWLNSSANNALYNNSCNATKYVSYVILGVNSSHFNHTIGTDNTAKQKPINYTYNGDNLIFDNMDFTSYGALILGWCRNMTVSNSNFSTESLVLYNTNQSTIRRNNFTTNVGFGILLHSYSKLNNITDNEVNTYGSEWYGIHLDTGSTHNNISGNTVFTRGTLSKGIRLEGNSMYNTIANNNVTTTATSSYGIYLTSSSYNDITNNSVKTSDYAIYLTSSSLYCLINNNSIVTTGTSDYGIYLVTSSIINKIYGNNITTRGTSGYGIYIGSNNNIFKNNNITTFGSTGHGIYISGSYQDNEFLEMNVKTLSSGYPFYLYSGNPNFTISDSILNSSTPGIAELYINNAVTGGTQNFTNVTKSDAGRINITWVSGAKGMLNVMWYLNVNVSDINGNPLQNANVTVWDVNNTLKFSFLTGADGKIAKQTLIEYNRSNGANITYYTNHTINISLAGYTSNLTSINLSTNVWLNVILSPAGADTTPPDISFIIPTPANDTNLSQNNYYVNVSISEAASTVYLELTNTSGKINYTMTSTITTNFWFNVTSQHNMTYFYVYANDTSNNWNRSLVRFVNIVGVTSCGILDKANTAYILQNNVTSTGTCFTVQANNITLDCQDYTINYSSNGGDQKYGIYSTQNLTTVKSCVIKEGKSTGTNGYGIYFNGGENGTINNNTITTIGDGSIGIDLSLSPNSIVSNNIITASGFIAMGIYLDLNPNSTFLNNTITTSGSLATGIYNPISSTFSGNKITVLSNDAYCIEFGSPANNLLYNNLFNSTNNFVLTGEKNYWNTSQQSGARVYNNGTNIGGNYYTNATATGFSDVCADANTNGFCDLPYNVSTGTSCSGASCGNNTDYLAYSNKYSVGGSSCGTLSTPNSIYTLANNVTSTGTCFTVGALNVTIDCQGYLINYSTSGALGYGVYSTYNSTNVKNCIISEGNITVNKHAIWFNGASNGTISGNTIRIVNDSIGIYLSFDSFNSVLNNTIVTSSNNALGVYLYSSTSNAFSNNIITVLGVGFYLLVGSNSNVFSNNIVATYGSWGRGIYVYSNTNNNSFSGMNIWTNGSAAYAFYINYQSHNFTMRDSILNSSEADFIISSTVTEGEWNFTNVTRADGSQITVSWTTGNGIMNMNWYLDVNVSSAGISLQNANVSGWNVNSTLLFSEFTGTNGRIGTKTILEYSRNLTNKVYYTPHNMTTTLAGYVTNSTLINLTASKTTWLNVVLQLLDTTPPDISFIIPIPVNDTNLTQNNYFVNVSISEPASSVYLELTNSTGTVNYTMTQTTNSNFWFNVTLQGNYTTYFYVYANDTANNWNRSFVRFVNISLTSGIDRTNPNGIGFITPTPANDTNLSQNNYFVNVSFNDSKPDWCMLELKNSTGAITNYTMSMVGANITNFQINLTNQANYTAYFTAYCNDTSNNWGSSAYRFVNISLLSGDWIAPSCSFIIPTPANDTNLSQDNYLVNLTCSESLSNITLEFTNASGKFNYTMTAINSINYYRNMTQQGNYTTYFTAYMNDSSDNRNKTEYRFVNISLPSGIDRVAPNGVGFIVPTPDNDTNLTQNNYYVRVTFNDSKPDSCLLQFTNSSGTINYTMSAGANSTTFNFNATGQGNFTTYFTAYCNDTSANWNKSGYRFVNISLPGTLPDLTPPNGVGFIVPTPNNDTNLTQNNYFVNATFNDTNPGACLLEFNGATNYTMTQATGNTTNYYRNMTGLSNGVTYFKAYCNDTSNNWGSSAMRFVNISYISLGISGLNAFAKGMEWMKWNWTENPLISITECQLYEKNLLIEIFNTTLTTYNKTFLSEGVQYNLSCRGYDASNNVGAWASTMDKTGSVLDKTIVNLRILLGYLRGLLGMGG